MTCAKGPHRGPVHPVRSIAGTAAAHDTVRLANHLAFQAIRPNLREPTRALCRPV